MTEILFISKKQRIWEMSIEAVQKYRKQLDQKKAQRGIVQKQLRRAVKKSEDAQEYHEDAIKARTIFQTAAENTQKIMEEQMSTLVTSAMEGIFPDPYEFLVRFVQRRNKTECDLLFRKNGEEYKPVESSGGGPLDIASFALRVAFWCIQKNRNTIILDEPFKFLSVDLQPKAGELLKRLSDELGIQFIVITHLSELLPFGDNIIKIEKGKLIL